jgi:aryl-alcohol dehydrogenase-like predicted oxidoreductase
MAEEFTLASYRLLGRSGLRVSPLALGTMTFGESWGAPEDESRRIFDTYADHGGNFVDTAGFYAKGVSESLTGKFAAGKRDQLVISTKYTLAVQPGDPNAAGNSRISMVRGVEQSLRRLATDRIDLLFLHVWDNTTPAGEILRAFDDLVRAGKILYIGISDTPAWQIARLQTMAELRGWTQLIALQAEYSLLQRSSERELIPAAQAMGLGVLPWSPLASGKIRQWRAAAGRSEGWTWRDDHRHGPGDARQRGRRRCGSACCAGARRHLGAGRDCMDVGQPRCDGAGDRRAQPATIGG